MRKRVVFHVGAHKTGTSLLQKYMRDNRTRLRTNRIYYVDPRWSGRVHYKAVRNPSISACEDLLAR